MSIVEFNTNIFTTDSSEYEILYNAAVSLKHVEGAILEIGTREGGSAKIIIDALAKNHDTKRSMFCIDPYGNIDFPVTHSNEMVNTTSTQQGAAFSVKLDYTNDMRRKIIPSLYFYAYQKGLNFSFFCLEDTEFMKRFHDGVPVYDECKKIEDKYALVFFDGPHTLDVVMQETEFFSSRVNPGSAFVYDDIWMYDHNRVEEYIFSRGFIPFNKGNVKASYKKI